MLNPDQVHGEDREYSMTELKAAALKANLSEHFVFNAFNAIQYFITVDDKDSAIRYLAMFSRLIRYQLNQYDADYAMLGPEIELLRNYIELQRMRYSGSLEFHFSHNIHPGLQRVMIPPSLLLALLENVIERSVYRMNHDPDEAILVDMKLECADELNVDLTCKTYSDTNGKGGYRDELLTWEDHVDQLNRLKNYKIRTEATIIPEKNGQDHVVKISVAIPILTA